MLLHKKLKPIVKKLRGNTSTFGAPIYFIGLLLARDILNHDSNVLQRSRYLASKKFFKQTKRFQLRCKISQKLFCVLTWKHQLQHLESASIRLSCAGSLAPCLPTERWMSSCFILKHAAPRCRTNTARKRLLGVFED